MNEFYLTKVGRRLEVCLQPALAFEGKLLKLPVKFNLQSLSWRRDGVGEGGRERNSERGPGRGEE